LFEPVELTGFREVNGQHHRLTGASAPHQL
jgi:hypothetical protein